MNTLPLLTSCDGCGACCLVVVQPPFVRHLDETAEAGWDRLQRERPDLVLAIEAARQERKRQGMPSYGTPCLWYDDDTRGCRHYELRPQACRDFAINSVDCHDARRRAHLV